MGAALPSLEDVFLEVVGRSLSDDDAADEDGRDDLGQDVKENTA
jgi:hypothetical protein